MKLSGPIYHDQTFLCISCIRNCSENPVLYSFGSEVTSFPSSCLVMLDFLKSTNLPKTPQSTCVHIITLQNPDLSVAFGHPKISLNQNGMKDSSDLVWILRTPQAAVRIFVPEPFSLKWGVITCTVNRTQWISPLSVFVSNSSFFKAS